MSNGKLRDSSLGPDILIAPLHGELSQGNRNRRFSPRRQARRKIVLATSIAETSLTIEGVRVVIDAGLMRVPRFDPRSGLTSLDTIRVTQDAADQRRGRAGRLEPGSCYRLWTVAEQAALLPAGLRKSWKQTSRRWRWIWLNGVSSKRLSFMA